MSLAPRKEAILKIIVKRYIDEANPVASETIARNYSLRISPATVRNEVACLEEERYIIRSHRSAGSIPTDKAYRYYVESIREDIELPLAEQYLIYKLFHETGREIEQWLKLAAAFLARFARNMAMITAPRAPQCRLKHLDLVALQDFVALLVLVLYEAKVKQQILSFGQKIAQNELTRLANKLNAIYTGMTGHEIAAKKMGLSVEEEQVTNCVLDIMAGEDKLQYGKPYLQGLCLMLNQPEFANSPKILNILELLEGEDWLRNIFPKKLDKRKIKVIIGAENPEHALQDLSLIISQYGIPDKASGIVGVLGPKRMDYARAISSVNYLSSLLNKSVVEYI